MLDIFVDVFVEANTVALDSIRPKIVISGLLLLSLKVVMVDKSWM